ncbi:TPA: FecR domain-containing protein [Pseudomonas aeruginosa]|uniref:FecR family protein n=1 Tax=Pseudomonas aeruginosa TaxID=287 RepID=UPI00053DFD50|nr:FecR family protein [Pseudomonas aeruginosa]ELK4796425.1 FecR family protein [Pseudomonas aeruginosa]MBH3764174.1 FecR family protein [Pseudomonas aeruginosa]MBI9180043.1 FecR family protein [Pseudomonas aeruginosa]OWH99777.1 peptide ABC transporter substrate-binding protein [Pseudomonas aeruginosa]QPP30777.1 FecR family protein [Pseudomonas aeruginosa]
MKTPLPADSDTLVQDAAHWCMRLHAEDCSEEERAEFRRWLASDPRHADEYAAMEEIWQLSELLPRRSDTPAAAPAWPCPRTTRRRHWRNQARAAALALFLLPASAYLGWLQGWIPSSYQRYTAQDNIRHVTLPDGSEVELDLKTHLSFANFRDIRRVVLDNGEAYFHVTHDTAHPFVVRAGKGSITVTGTRFNVWKYQDNVVVTVTEGSVKVRSEGSGNDSSLTPGMQASYYPGLLQPLVEAVDTRQALAWREGRLILDDLPLAQALPLINRYLEHPLVLTDKTSAELRIGGIYSTREIRNLVEALPKVLPVDLEHRDDGSIRISSRYAQL